MQITLFNGITKNLSSRRKNEISAIAFILLLTASAMIAIIPAVLATPIQYPNTAMPPRPTGTAVAISPTLVGLTQQVLINIIVYPAPSGPTFYAQDLVQNVNLGIGSSFANISCSITSPDGTKNTFMPTDFSLQHANINVPGLAELVGSLQFFYTPTQVGNYSVTASFPGQTFDTAAAYKNLNDTVYYQPSSSINLATFTVQQDQVLSGLLNGYPWSPLPTGYWTTPVFTNNREWSVISGPWIEGAYNAGFSDSAYNPYTTAPTTPHILWTSTPDGNTAVGASGIAGGIFGSNALNQGSGGSGNIIMDGNIYQAGPTINTPGNPGIAAGYMEAINLRTGQLLWTAPASAGLSGAWQFSPPYQTAAQGNEGGIFECLWGLGAANWTQYSPVDGHILRTFTNVPSDLGSKIYENGNEMFYGTQFGSWNTTSPLARSYDYLIGWNYTKMISTVGTNQAFSSNWLSGVQFNVSVIQPGQVVNPGDGNFRVPTPFVFDAAGVVVVMSVNDERIMTAFDMNTGALRWVNNATDLNLDVTAGGVATSPNGPIIVQNGQAQWVAYSVSTGQELWRVPTGNLPWSMLPAYTFVSNNGISYFGSYDGHVYAYNLQTGKQVWQSDYVGASDEAIYGNQPFNGFALGGGGILYYSTSTTYSLEPRTRFHELIAINETTGHFLWTLPIDINPSAIAYGYLVGKDSENGIQYCFGQGLTSTTVQAPLTAVPSGTPMTVLGSVMDLSPAQTNTPAISDADMSLQMDYLHGQNATLINSPPTPHGVPVILTAVDPNGNVVNIGTVTSDSSGQFATSFTPSTAGLYTIYATFAGSGAYYSSYAETHVTVVAASTTSPTSTSTASVSVTNSDLMTTVIVGIIAIIIAIVIVGVLMLRKK